MLHLDVDIDLICIMRVGQEFSDSIKYLLFVYKNLIKNNFIFLINSFKVSIYTASTTCINSPRNQIELLAETTTNSKQEL